MTTGGLLWVGEPLCRLDWTVSLRGRRDSDLGSGVVTILTTKKTKKNNSKNTITQITTTTTTHLTEERYASSGLGTFTPPLLALEIQHEGS